MEYNRLFISQLQQYLLQNWNKFQISESPLDLTYRIKPAPKGRAQEKSRDIAFWFTKNKEQPVIVTKWAKSKQFSLFTIQEHNNALWLYDTRQCRFIPKPLGIPEIMGFPVLVEEAVPGISLAEKILQHTIDIENITTPLPIIYSYIFMQASNFLLHIQGAIKPITKIVFWQEFSPYFTRTEKILGWNHEKSEKVKSYINETIADPIPQTGEVLLIGDFAPQNILETERGAFLIDLEFSRKSYLAFLDAVSFAFNIFRLTTKAMTRIDIEKAAQLFQSFILSEDSSLSSMLHNNFFASCGLNNKYFPWYWLVFLIHETAFQHFICEEFPPHFVSFFDTLITNILT